MPHSTNLDGQRVLLVEDEWVIAVDLVHALREDRAEVVGPVPTLLQAMQVLASERAVTCAVVDVNLRGIMAYPLADELQRRGVPFLFTTGYDAESLPPRYARLPRCQKPVDARDVARTLRKMLA